MSAVLAADALGVSVKGRWLLRGVTVHARAGEVLAVLGPNGAGKSTLLAALSGARRPDEGEVRFGGVSLRSLSLRELARRRAVLSQAVGVPFPFTCREVVLLGRTPFAGESSAERDEEIARAALESVGAEHLGARTFPTLSGGEQQRVQLARALAQLWEVDGARALLLDEPTASLDPAHQHLILSLVRRVATRGACVVVVLHDLALAARYADQVLLLSQGNVRAAGAPRGVLTPATLRDVYGVEAHVVGDERGFTVVTTGIAGEAGA